MTTFCSDFKFCPHSASPLQDFADGDVSRRRCATCEWIQYRNPTVGVALVLLEDDQLLIGRRRDGGLCIPCGHVEWDESVEEAAQREFEEETGLQVSLTGLVAVQSNSHDPEQQTVGIWYRGRREGGELRPGGDLLDIAFVELAKVSSLKFPTDTEVIRILRSTI